MTARSRPTRSAARTRALSRDDTRSRTLVRLAGGAVGAALLWSLWVATDARAQISSAPAAARATPEAAGAGRGGDPSRQAAAAANQQADAAFQRADRDGDGRLSRAEADHLPAIAARFEQVDANRDQFISRDEFNRVLAP